jgi:hypothetical protein
MRTQRAPNVLNGDRRRAHSLSSAPVSDSRSVGKLTLQPQYVLPCAYDYKLYDNVLVLRLSYVRRQLISLCSNDNKY